MGCQVTECVIPDSHGRGAREGDAAVSTLSVRAGLAPAAAHTGLQDLQRRDKSPRPSTPPSACL